MKNRSVCLRKAKYKSGRHGWAACCVTRKLIVLARLVTDWRSVGQAVDRRESGSQNREMAVGAWAHFLEKRAMSWRD